MDGPDGKLNWRESLQKSAAVAAGSAALTTEIRPVLRKMSVAHPIRPMISADFLCHLTAVRVLFNCGVDSQPAACVNLSRPIDAQIRTPNETEVFL